MARGRAANYAEQQQGLLHHAAQLFAERGFQGTSMLELASAAGVSKALLYHYYEDSAERAAGAARVWELIANGTLDVTIGQTYALDDVAQAHRDLEARRTTGSTVLVV